MPNYQGGREPRPFAALNPTAYSPAQLKKVGVFLVTALSQAVSLGLLDGTLEKVALCVLTAAGAFGIFAVRNAD